MLVIVKISELFVMDKDLPFDRRILLNPYWLVYLYSLYMRLTPFVVSDDPPSSRRPAQSETDRSGDSPTLSSQPLVHVCECEHCPDLTVHSHLRCCQGVAKTKEMCSKNGKKTYEDDIA